MPGAHISCLAVPPLEQSRAFSSRTFLSLYVDLLRVRQLTCPTSSFRLGPIMRNASRTSATTLPPGKISGSCPKIDSDSFFFPPYGRKFFVVLGAINFLFVSYPKCLCEMIFPPNLLRTPQKLFPSTVSSIFLCFGRPVSYEDSLSSSTYLSPSPRPLLKPPLIPPSSPPHPLPILRLIRSSHRFLDF